MSKNQTNEHIRKIMSKTKYVLESPAYRAIIDDDYESYDSPDVNAGTQPLTSNSMMVREADPIPGEEPTAAGEPVGDPPMDDPMADPMGAPEADPMAGAPDEVGAPEGEVDVSAEIGPEGGEMEAEVAVEEPNADELQNQIIKQNIDVMKQLNQKIEDLEAGIDGLAQQNDKLNFKNDVMAKEVEEVREPTNVEKLMSKKQDSHPYYYGLNDMWEGNWFQARRDEQGDKGMKQMDDGSYIADFDDMDQMNDNELNKSFN